MPKEEERRTVHQIDSIGGGGAVRTVLALMFGNGGRPCDEGKGKGSTEISLEHELMKETQNYKHAPAPPPPPPE